MSRSRFHRAVIAAALLIVAIAMVGLTGTALQERPARRSWEIVPEPPKPVTGKLRISLYGDAVRENTTPPLEHSTSWINGPRYRGMTDNDIRGFLDGTYRYGWNQSTQIHVRIGRKHLNAGGGEAELFRILQRWDGISLPRRAEVTGARLELEVERGIERPIDLFVYPVYRDWGPGRGGVDRNNNSAPAPGELWWNAPRRGEAPWGLPGAGLARADSDRADTPPDALARARYRPGASVLRFEGGSLAAYLQRRFRSAAPALLLFKVADYLEDRPDSRLALYSADHGDSRNSARRPRLQLRWRAPSEVRGLERRLILEYGRELHIGPLPADDAVMLAASFDPEPGSASPTILFRGGTTGRSSEWAELPAPAEIAWDWVELRISTCVNATPYGEPFVAELADTWVTTGPPEAQRVEFEFLSPSGELSTREAEYLGDFRWRVEFRPEEVGRYHYRWRQTFIDEPYTSAVGTFDVVIQSVSQASLALARLTEDIRAARIDADRERAARFAERFQRTERAVVNVLAAEGTSPWPRESTADDGPMALLEEAREALGGDRGEHVAPPLPTPDRARISPPQP